MPVLRAQPYDITANGFYFESHEEYINMDTIARDLEFDYTETEIAGEWLIYRAA